MRRLIALWLALLVSTACGGGGGTDEDTSEDTGLEDSAVDGDVTVDTAGEDVVVHDGPCTRDEHCNDGDPCTSDHCDREYGECVHDDVDADGDGFTAARVDGTECGGTDCDDTDEEIYPGSTAVDCDGDMDCSGGLDAEDDRDGDGFLTDECGGDDCDDLDRSAFPGSTAVDCSILDHDCNGFPDEDNDGDGYARLDGCHGTDCDDENPDVNPGETEETCDGYDTDCDGSMDVEEDADGDGFANETCVAAGEEADCDDGDDNIYPGAIEVCDMIDQDCDGSWADGGADSDGDGGLDWRCGGDDCDDADATVFFGAPEICVDGIDQDCDDIVDGPMRLPSKTFVYDGESWTFKSSMVWGGSQWGLAWEDESYVFYDIYFARLDADGTLIGSVQDVTDTVTSMSTDPALAWTGSEFVVSWTDNRTSEQDVFIRRISDTGSYTSSEIQVTDGTAWVDTSDIAWTGSELGLVWADDQFEYYWELSYQRLDPDGTLLGSQVRLTTATQDSFLPSMAWNGSEYGLAFRDNRDGNRDIWFMTMDPAGTKIVSDTKLIYSTAYSYYPDITWATSRWAIAWQDGRHYQWEIYMAFADTSGSKLGTDIRITNDPAVSWRPSIAYSGSQFALLWTDNRATDYHAYVALTDDDGVKTSSDIQLTLTGADCNGTSMAWSGSAFGLMWYDNHSGLEGIYHDQVAMCD